MTARLWCLTEQDDPEGLFVCMELCFQMAEGDIRYICGQLEECPSTGKLHLQGYIQLREKRGMGWLKQNVSATAHFEKQRGTNKEARDYCCKSETSVSEFKEFGVFTKGQGDRIDIKSFKNKIIEGKTKKELIDIHTNEMAKYPRFYDLVRSMFPPKRDSDLSVELYYGDPGSGKTRKAYEENPDLYCQPLVNGQIWFDGYDLHKVVLLDDFNGAASKVGLDYTLRLLDRYPVQVPIKGGHAWWLPDKIVITTNIHPHEWYDWTKREIHYNALKRRIHRVYVFHDGAIEEWDKDDFFNESQETIFH